VRRAGWLLSGRGGGAREPVSAGNETLATTPCCPSISDLLFLSLFLSFSLDQPFLFSSFPPTLLITLPPCRRRGRKSYLYPISRPPR